jgi:hypothetical protein
MLWKTPIVENSASLLRLSFDAMYGVAMTERETLLHSIIAYCVRNNIPETVFGMRTMNDPSLVSKMRKGRSVRIDTAERLRAYMREHDKKRTGRLVPVSKMRVRLRNRQFRTEID